MSDGRDDRDAEVLERMERGLPPASDEERAIRADYRRLIDRIDELDAAEPDPGWVERGMDRWRRERKPRGDAAPAPPPRRKRVRRAPFIAAGAAIAIAAAIVLVPRCGRREAEKALLVTVNAEGRAKRSTDAAVGDTLAVRSRGRGAHGEVRVYRDGALIARCPGDARCGVRAGAIDVDLVMDARGRYDVLGVWAERPWPAPVRYDVDRLAAQELDGDLQAHTQQAR